MKQNRKIPILLGISAIALFFAVLLRNSVLSHPKDQPNPEGGTTYYTGPMRPLGGKNYLASEDGKMSPLPDPPKTAPGKTEPKKPATP